MQILWLYLGMIRFVKVENGQNIRRVFRHVVEPQMMSVYYTEAVQVHNLYTVLEAKGLLKYLNYFQIKGNVH